MGYSTEQYKAIRMPGNVIVSAGAGSGKTTVMIERIVYGLLRGQRLEDMLIVTFTRAAAADMRYKLAEKLAKLKREPDSLDSTIKEELALPPERISAIAAEAADALPVCEIGTLHGYCQRLIKTYFYAAGIDPSASVADDAEMSALKDACIRAEIESARESGDARFSTVFDALGSRRNDDGAAHAIAEIIDFALSLPEPYEYLKTVRSDCERAEELEAMLAAERAYLVGEAELLRADIAAINFTTIAKAADDLVPYMDGRIDEITRTSHRAKQDERDALNDRLKALKKACKKYREDREEKERACAVDSTPYSAALCETALCALQRYAARKAALGKLDYSDLEHGAERVLADKTCMSEIAARVKYVFIDEYQDVNPLQAGIADRFKAAGAKMFLVGDIKQSIYAFRRCDLKYFRSALTDADYVHIPLNNNYRSAPEIIDFINGVFTDVMTEDYGGTDYRVDRLVYGGVARPGGSAQFCLVPKDGGGDDGDDEGESVEEANTAEEPGEAYSVMHTADELAAPDPQCELIASRILEYIEQGVKSGSPRSFGDIAVLMRSARGAFCGRLINTFGRYGIPYSLGKRSRVRDFPEAAALVEILRNTDNRFDDLSLYVALRSPMGGFSDRELLDIARAGGKAARARGIKGERSGGRTYSFRQKADCYYGPLKDRLDAFFALRERFTEYGASHDAADTLGYITAEIDYFRHVYEHGGCAAAVEALISKAADRRCDVPTFLSLVGGDTELDADAGGDAVSIMTIHASKGLEFDFVIVADVDHRMNFSDASARVIVSDRGVAVKYPDAAERVLLPSVSWLAERAGMPNTTRQEEMRLFYVALTRARRRLLVCGRDRRAADMKKARSELDFMHNMYPDMVYSVPELSPYGDGEPPATEAGAGEAIAAAVRARCEFEYKSSDIPVKTCVTALADRADDEAEEGVTLTDDEVEERPRGGKRRGGDGAQEAKLRGTAYHRAMELIDFAAPDTNAVRPLVDNGELVDFSKIQKAAETMRTLTKDAAYCFKERYFIADLPTGGGSTLVQGVIDLLIIGTDGSATIVDYKTTAPQYLDSDGYKTQLRLYAAAVERATPYKVTGKYLYSFELGKLIAVD